MFSKKTYLICIVGPTAVGKTSLAIRLAQKLKCEIISCDSRQFYRELEIGTAKPNKEELSTVTHHFINNLSIQEDYNVMDFEKEVLQKIDQLHQNNPFAVMVGGSGLFYKAVVDGFDEIPAVDSAVRESLISELEVNGIERLQNELKEKDPQHYDTMDIQNPQRLIRALEVCRSTGKPYSYFRNGSRKSRPFETIKIGLDMERELLYDRINQRMDLMLDIGLVDEVKLLVPYRSKNALQTVGYKEIFEFLDGNYDWDECLRLLKRNSRRYAKRQFTWFKKDEEIQWVKIDPTKDNENFEAILELLKSYSIEVNQD